MINSFAQSRISHFNRASSSQTTRNSSEVVAPCSKLRTSSIMPSVMPYHPGELSAQGKARTSGVAAELAPGISPRLSMDTGIASFFQSIRMVILSSIDASGHVWSSVAFGSPGFVAAENDTSLRIGARDAIPPHDPFWENTAAEGAPVGIVAIDLARRLRYRTNGTVVATGSSQVINIRVQEAFFNCPKYIQSRELEEETALASPLSNSMSHSGAASLSEDDSALISRADAFFLGTFFRDTGADANHRGGAPGFVRVASPTEIVWPDYRGNGMFQSFGNLECNNEAGVVFIDFNTGDVLQLSGKARVDWKAADVLDGAPRVVRFDIRDVIRTRSATDYRWRVPEYSLYNPPLQTLDRQLAQAPNQTVQIPIQAEFPVNVLLAKIVSETRLVKTFRFLAPRVIKFRPGQYATFQFDELDGLDLAGPEVRTWTLSEAANSIEGDNSLEISVKRKHGGLISSWLHEHAKVGLKAKLMGVGGDMTPIAVGTSEGGSEHSAPKNLLLISGGIGITPNIAIVRGIGAYSLSDSTRITMVHQERHEEDLPFQKELKRRASADNFRLVNFASRDAEPKFARPGRISAQALGELVPNPQDQTVFLCGPAGFMQSVAEMLVESGVPPDGITTEHFDF